MKTDFAALSILALRSAVNAKMGLNKDAADKYRAEGKLEAAAKCEGRYEAFYEIERILLSAKQGEEG